MNNYEFYSNLQKYQENDIEHGIGSKITGAINSGYNWVKSKVTGQSDFQPTYYQKIDNAYGPGKARYFYSKEEWDAYQRELRGYNEKAKEDVKLRNAQMSRNQGADIAAKQRAAQEKYNREVSQNVRSAQSGREAAMRNSLNQQQAQKNLDNARVREAQQGRDAAIKNALSRNNSPDSRRVVRKAYEQSEAGRREAEAERQRQEQIDKDKAFVKNVKNQQLAQKQQQEKAAREADRQSRYNAEKSSQNAYKAEKAIKRDEIIQNVIKDVKAEPANQHKSLEDYAKKYDMDPEDLAIGLYSSTGWLLPSDTVEYGNSENRNIRKKG